MKMKIFIGLGAWSLWHVCLLATLKGEEVGIPSDADLNIAKVVNFWQVREKKVQTFKFRWEEQQTFTTGALMDPSWPIGKNPNKLTLPSRDEAFPAKFELVVAGDKVRYSHTGVAIGFKKGIIPNQLNQSVFNGKEAKSYYEPIAAEYGTGFISDDKTNPDVKTVSLEPILRNLRPFHPSMGFATFASMLDPSVFRLQSQHALVRGRSCLILERRPTPPDPYTERFYLDPDRDCVIIRSNLLLAGKLVYELDITELKQDIVWVPVEWKSHRYDRDGRLESSITANVTDFSINKDIPDEEFNIEFPPGTWVKVRKGGKIVEQFIQREGGQKRLITPEEEGASYAQLLNSESGMAFQVRKKHHSYLPLSCWQARAC